MLGRKNRNCISSICGKNKEEWARKDTTTLGKNK